MGNPTDIVKLRGKEGHGKFLTILHVTTLMSSLYWLYIYIEFNTTHNLWGLIFQAPSLLAGLSSYWGLATVFLTPVLVISVWSWKKAAVYGLFLLWIGKLIRDVILTYSLYPPVHSLDMVTLTDVSREIVIDGLSIIPGIIWLILWFLAVRLKWRLFR